MDNHKKSIPQYAIAKKLGLSPSTVSKVFRNRHDVGSETRRRVLETAQSMGYSKRLTDKKNRSSRKDYDGLMIGMLVRLGPYTPKSYQPDYLQGVSEVALELGVSLIIHCLDGSTNEERFFKEAALQPAALRAGKLSGLLLTGVWSSEGLQWASQTLPAVAVAYGTQKAVIDSVEPDTLLAMRDVVHHLKALGHQRLAFVGLCRQDYWSVERYVGCVAAAASLQMSLPPEAVIELPRSVIWDEHLDDTWREEAQSLLRLIQEEGVTAVVCASDWVAFHVHWALSQHGLSIPQDVSLFGFDDHEYTTLGGPSVSSVRIPRSDLAAHALRQAVDRCSSKRGATRRTMFPCRLTDHGTTASPKTRRQSSKKAT